MPKALILEAQANAADVKKEIARLKLELLNFTAEQQRSRDAEREAARRKYDALLADVLKTLDVALRAAKTASDKVMSIQFARHEATNEVFDPLHWFEFSLRYEQWRAIVKSYGVDLDQK